ncbi:hypothetical protein ElyMa_004423900 [Elysia marginata]|uniref:Uncharacterized protein n=1 Tax=Elysia marginata TaxID=1093978 RepID=A0AAV4HCR2_9GAST|nr:hypothetical protein ElyMa_004423900 [Elysia marginata]
MRHNHVITFKAHRKLGEQQKTCITLPALPHTYQWGAETILRFWRYLKRFHLLGSVFFLIPGMGPNRVDK